jgi:PAS domain S-box-containing protein
VKTTGALCGVDRFFLPPAGAAWLTVAAVAISYFLAAQLGLALLSKSTDVAVFWPASGFAVGILILLGPRGRVAVVIGVISATIAANLMSDRSLLTSLLKGFCNAGEAVLTAWLIEQWFGREFAFDDLRRVLGFVAAACLGAAASALGGAATMTLFHTAAPFWDVWRAWFLSDGVGIVVVAPLIIALSQVWREPPSQGEWIEGAVGVTLMALISWYVVYHPSGSWLSFDPDVLSLPPLLWLTARCQPAFGIAGALVTSLAFICATTFGIGHFGNEDVPITVRANGAQVVITMVTLYTLVLAGLFTERRRNEAALKSTLRAEKEGNTRLADAMAAGQVLAFEWDACTGRSQRSNNADRIMGFAEEGRFMQQVHPEDRENLRTHMRSLSPDNPSYALTFRFVRADGHHVWLEETAKAEFDSTGRLLRIKGLTRDITLHKQAEQTLAERNAQLELAGEFALVGRFATEIDVARGDFKSQRAQISPGFATIYGLPDETVEISVGDWRSLVHSDDLPHYLEHRQKVFAERRREHHAEFRIVRPCGTIRWIEARSFIEYDQAGHVRRLVGVNIDITERKRAEVARKILNAELDHRVKNALATVTAVVSHTREGSRSVADFAAALEGRIRSMAATHQLLSSRHWQELALIEVIRSELAPYAASKNTEISGPTVLLKPEAGQALAMVLHELATNAAKYGALSTNTGRVLIRWDRRLNGGPLSNLVLEWQEVGGPQVNAPGKSSYGTSTIRDLIPYEFGGTVDLMVAGDGVRCRLELPADWLSNDGEPVSESIAHATQRARNA